MACLLPLTLLVLLVMCASSVGNLYRADGEMSSLIAFWAFMVGLVCAFQDLRASDYYFLRAEEHSWLNVVAAAILVAIGYSYGWAGRYHYEETRKGHLFTSRYGNEDGLSEFVFPAFFGGWCLGGLAALLFVVIRLQYHWLIYPPTK